MNTLHFATDIKARRPAVLARGLNAVSQIFRAWMNRREFYRLGEMSDAELQDIGLTRGDLHVAIAQPSGLDPTLRLRAIVEARNEAV